MPPSKAKGPEQPIRTFDEAFASHRLKPPEREALVWHLAYMRLRKTIEALLPARADYGTVNEQTRAELELGFRPKDILR